MKKILKFIKDFYAEMGIVVGSLIALSVILSFPFWLPIALLSNLNDLSKKWFGDSNG